MTSKTPLAAQLEYLYGLKRFGIKPGLAVMEQLMTALGHPERAFRAVHITGTNGKGSTAALIAAVLQEAGVHAGLYTSPHLYEFNERIRVNGQAIGDDELLALIQEVQRVVGEQELQPTFFEFTTTLALLYFARTKVKLAVVEVGMGGDRDATNVVQPVVSVITNIGLDHTDWLGHTTADIARRKAGIIKHNVPLVTAERDEKILGYFRDVCATKRSTFHVVQEEVPVVSLSANWQEQTFLVSGLDAVPSIRQAETFSIRLLGGHQLTNAATALATLKVLRKQGIEVSDVALHRGLARATWEGRLDLVRTNPHVLVDGAHNAAGLDSLLAFITDPTTRLPAYSVLVCAAKRDKDMSTLFEKIAPLFETVIATEGVYDPEPVEKLAAALRRNSPSVLAIANPQVAAAKAIQLAGPSGGVLIAGSLYMIPAALSFLRHKKTVGPLMP